MIKFAIFDLDGTILDSSIMWTTLGRRYLEIIGRHPDANLSEILSRMTLPESAQYMRQKFDIPYSSEEITRHLTRMTERFYLQQVNLKDGAPKLLSELRAHCVYMSIATAGDVSLSTTALQRLGVAEFFSGAVSCTDYGAKTSPEVFLAAADLIYAIPKETLVFEDSLYAVQTAKKAGFKTAAVYDSSESNQAELKECADFYARSLNEYAENISELLK